MKVQRRTRIEHPTGADDFRRGRAHLDRLERLEQGCSLALADARRVQAARRPGVSAGPWLARAGEMMDEMDELLELAGPAAPSDVRERVASLRRELQRLGCGAAKKTVP
jgi:DNA-binding PucR family transcriptional regulator